MSPQTTSTRQRLIHAARELFAELGVRDTTTRRIAELADVNEVTLFRHFGNKHGLFLAVLEESDVFQNLGRSLTQQVDPLNRLDRAIAEYADTHLQLLERFPKLICSAIGEADEYSAENRRALGRGLTEVNRHVAQYLLASLEQEQLQANLSPEIFASLLNGLLLGYLIVEFTTETDELWGDREVFLESLVQLFLHGAVSTSAVSTLGTVARVPSSPLNKEAALELVADLPASTVHEILRQAKRLSFQDYGLAYVAFAAGLTPGEMAGLRRSQQICNAQQHLLQVIAAQGMRQVPVNRWILGRHYGSYTANPLTRWLKSRKEEQSAMFLNDAGEPMSEAEICDRWQLWTEGLLAPAGHAPAIAQAQQTWCVDMLLRGVSLEDLSLLTGMTLAQLQPYARRAREKEALERVIRLDRKPGGGTVVEDSSDA